MKTRLCLRHRPRTPWTDKEVESLLEGIRLFGPQWTKILSAFQEDFHEQRTSTDLKDKYRNLEKQKRMNPV